MPKSRVVIYRESNGSIPFVNWFHELPDHAKDKVLVRIERLRDLGHELRASARGIHYRVLYFFHKQIAAIVAHGLIKESTVPDRERDLAVRRKAQFEADPSKHTFEEK